MVNSDYIKKHLSSDIVKTIFNQFFRAEGFSEWYHNYEDQSNLKENCEEEISKLLNEVF